MASGARSRSGLCFPCRSGAEIRGPESGCLLSFAQRRHHDAHDVEAKIKIVAEFSFAHELFEIFVRGCDQAHIGAQRLIAADAFERTLFAHDAQQFDLRARSISAISSRKSVPPLACSNRPMRRSCAPVNAPFS
jgi:hypothetical protein